MLLNSLTLHLQIILITDQKNVSLLTSIFLSARVTKKKKERKSLCTIITPTSCLLRR